MPYINLSSFGNSHQKYSYLMYNHITIIEIQNYIWKSKNDEFGAITKGAIILWVSPKVILNTNKLNFYIYYIKVRKIIPP